MKTQQQKFKSRTKLNPTDLLREAIDDRCRKNPQYSLRAFSRASGISPTVLSLVLSGKRKLSKKATLKLCNFLELEGRDRSLILQACGTQADVNFQKLSLDTFAVISDWYHYAILSALEIPGSKLEARWLAKHLEISQLEAKRAIERLKSLNLVEETEDGAWRQSGQSIKIENTESTAATRKYHRQLLQKATESIEKHKITERDFSAMTFAIDPSLIDYARKKIQAFRRELVADLESRGNAQAVYQINIQLFPLTTINKGSENENI